MPRANTECTEISIGFGLLKVEPLNHLKQTEVDLYFSRTLSIEKYNNFIEEFARNEKTYRKFYNIGLRLREAYPLFRNSNLRQIQWEGPNQQASTVTIAKDLLVFNTPISIKDNSNIISNHSPYNFFVRVPQGLPDLKRLPNWYLTIAPEEYQLLYSFAKDTWCPDYPTLIAEYHKSMTDSQRSSLAEKIKTAEKLRGINFQGYKNLYIRMCHKVSELSAEKFNQYFAGSLNNQERNPVIETLIRSFFRIGEQKYILCGRDRGKKFAVEIPDITTWKRHWRLKSLHAFPDKEIKREQSVVKFRLVVENKKNNQEPFELIYHAEIRWSHGRFCGNPEAKLYKDFTLDKVPFFVQLIKEQKYQKMEIIGEGGFGIVYKATRKKPKELVAYKELSKTFASFQEQEYERFRREVEILSEKLNHPNIIPVLDQDLSAPLPWFTMPLAQRSLAELLEADEEIKHDYRRVNSIFLQILEGMKYAHDRNVVHRDLKPQNILLFENDQVRIGDFGLGKQLDSSNSNISLTATSESLGSWPYVAPEQMKSFKDADFRTDIYSLGVILYECLTGEAPLRNLNLHLVDEHYKDLIIKCTEEDPYKRFQSVEELQEAFKQIYL